MLDQWERQGVQEVIDAVERRGDNRRMEYLRELFGEFCPDEEEVEVRSLLVCSLWIGSHSVAADHGDRSRGEVIESALARLPTRRRSA